MGRGVKRSLEYLATALLAAAMIGFIVTVAWLTSIFLSKGAR